MMEKMRKKSFRLWCGALVLLLFGIGGCTMQKQPSTESEITAGQKVCGDGTTESDHYAG